MARVAGARRHSCDADAHAGDDPRRPASRRGRLLQDHRASGGGAHPADAGAVELEREPARTWRPGSHAWRAWPGHSRRGRLHRRGDRAARPAERGSFSRAKSILKGRPDAPPANVRKTVFRLQERSIDAISPVSFQGSRSYGQPAGTRVAKIAKPGHDQAADTRQSAGNWSSDTWLTSGPLITSSIKTGPLPRSRRSKAALPRKAISRAARSRRRSTLRRRSRSRSWSRVRPVSARPSLRKRSPAGAG